MKKLMLIFWGALSIGAWAQVPSCTKEILAANALNPGLGQAQKHNFKLMSIDAINERLAVARSRDQGNPVNAMTVCNYEAELFARHQQDDPKVFGRSARGV
jgi:hypothetical protein